MGDAGGTGTGEPRRQADELRIFISYSRADVGFADELELALRSQGHMPLVDRHGIDAGENWQQRLGDLILSCDTVVFVFTDTSAASPICAWEVDEAIRLTKRVLVVTPGAVNSDVAAPPMLAGINWVHCWRNPAIPGSSQTKGFLDLNEALRTDLGWLRQKTILQEQSARWQSRQDGSDAEVSSMLLRGNLLDEALAWARSTPRHEEIPNEGAAFLSGSERNEARLKAEAAAGIAAREDALRRAEAAASEAAMAQAARSRAQRATRFLALASLIIGFGLSAFALFASYAAVSTSIKVAKTSSQIFARDARLLGSQGRETEGMLMALYGDPDAQGAWETRFFRPENGFEDVQVALQKNYAENQLLQQFRGYAPITAANSLNAARSVSSLLLLPRIPGEAARRFISATGRISMGGYSAMSPGTISLWRENEPIPLSEFIPDQSDAYKGVVALMTAPGGTPGDEHYLAAYSDGTVELRRVGATESLRTWSIRRQRSDQRANELFEMKTLASLNGETLVLAGWRDGLIELWQLGADTPIAEFPIGDQDSVYDIVLLSPDEAGNERFLASYYSGNVLLWHVGNSEPEQDFEPISTFNRASIVAVPEGYPGIGSFLRSGSAEGTVELWGLDGDRGPLRTFSVENYSARVTAIAMAPLNKRSGKSDDELLSKSYMGGLEFVVAYDDGTVRVWRGDLNFPTSTTTTRGGRISSLLVSAAPSSGDLEILVGSEAGELSRWRTRPSAPNEMIGVGTGALQFADAAATDGQTNAFVIITGRLPRIYRDKTSNEIFEETLPERLQFWDSEMSIPKWEHNLQPKIIGKGSMESLDIQSLQVFPNRPANDQAYLVSGEYWQAWIVEDGPNGKQFAVDEMTEAQDVYPYAPMRPLMPGRSGEKRLLTGVAEFGKDPPWTPDMAIWDLGGTQPEVFKSGLTAPGVYPTDLAVLPRVKPDDPEEFLAAFSDGTIQHWQVGAAGLLATMGLDARIDQIRPLRRAPNGSPRFLVKMFGRPLQLMQMSDAAPLKTFSIEADDFSIEVVPQRPGLDLELFVVAFDHYGMLGEGGEVQLWRTDAEQHLTAFFGAGSNWSGSGQYKLNVAVSKDGDRIIMAGLDKMIDVYRVDSFVWLSPKDQVQTACRRLLDIGVTHFSAKDIERFPMLRAPLNREPCKGIWPDALSAAGPAGIIPLPSDGTNSDG